MITRLVVLHRPKEHYQRAVESKLRIAPPLQGVDRDPDQLEGAIKRAFNAKKPSLVNIDIQRAISPRAEAAIARWNSETYQPF